MKRFYPMLGVVALLAAGCSQPVLRQGIPVSTNPVGAKIYANGEFAGTTPLAVSLERDRNHILTLIKENYRQEDVVIQRSYQKEKVYLNAIASGINSGLFFKDAGMGIGNSLGSMSAQETTGEAYVLVPPAVSIILTPVEATGKATAPAPAHAAEKVAGSSHDPGLDQAEMAKGLAKIGAAAAFSQANPLNKEKEISSSTKSYLKPDGTMVTTKTSSSAGVSVDPAGLLDALDVLFR